MFQELQAAVIVTMLEIYSRELKTCLREGDFPHTDVFKMVIDEAGGDTRLLYMLALNPRCKELLSKITNQIRCGNFEPACAGKKLAGLRSLFRFSQLLGAAV